MLIRHFVANEIATVTSSSVLVCYPQNRMRTHSPSKPRLDTIQRAAELMTLLLTASSRMLARDLTAYEVEATK